LLIAGIFIVKMQRTERKKFPIKMMLDIALSLLFFILAGFIYYYISVGKGLEGKKEFLYILMGIVLLRGIFKLVLVINRLRKLNKRYYE